MATREAFNQDMPPAVATYNYLRLALLGLVALLGVSVGYEIFVNDTELGSISAYYYTPARSVFVGTLVGAGVAMVAIKGREGSEDVLLNVAGVLAPIVALVPAAVAAGTIVNGHPVVCGSGDSCVPSAFEGGITNGAWSLGIVGVVVYLVVVALAVKGGKVGWGDRERRAATIGLVVAAAVLAFFLVLDIGFHAHYVQWGHYYAAVPMFAGLTAVVVINALRSERATVTMGARTVDWRYAALALWMGVVLLAAGGYFAVTTWITDSEPWDTWVFWVELLLLIPFTLYWILQTIEWWHDGSPGLGPGGQPTSVETSDSS